MGFITTISISQEFHDLAKEHGISWSEAARVGMSVLLAEKGFAEYDNNLNLVRRMNAFRIQAEQSLQKLHDLQPTIY